ncbi:MAG: type II toxin-antitoxin system Phd/YefM family antitoxin [Deltaproteobacteria bacterium]|nr:type II toxin-antitoxin system Phd/YefM family antitoxin [Deltaproteobacteria bacterium]
MKQWQLQDAKNRFSEVVDKALKQGPQIVTRRGREAVVIMSVEEYRQLTRTETNLVDFFRKSPLRGVHLNLDRDKDFAREIDL